MPGWLSCGNAARTIAASSACGKGLETSARASSDSANVIVHANHPNTTARNGAEQLHAKARSEELRSVGGRGSVTKRLLIALDARRLAGKMSPLWRSERCKGLSKAGYHARHRLVRELLRCVG